MGERPVTQRYSMVESYLYCWRLVLDKSMTRQGLVSPGLSQVEDSKAQTRRVKRRTCSDSEVRTPHLRRVQPEKTRVRTLIHDLQQSLSDTIALQHLVILLFIQRLIPPFRWNNVPPQPIQAAPTDCVKPLDRPPNDDAPPPRWPSPPTRFSHLTPYQVHYHSILAVRCGASTDKAPSSPFSGPLDSQTHCFDSRLCIPASSIVYRCA